jgi:hypothetical protein
VLPIWILSKFVVTRRELWGDFSVVSLKPPAKALAIAAIMTVTASMSMTPTTGETAESFPGQFIS